MYQTQTDMLPLLLHTPYEFTRPWQRGNELDALAWILGGGRVKPLKPDETMHETAWQACETDETG